MSRNTINVSTSNGMLARANSACVNDDKTYNYMQHVLIWNTIQTNNSIFIGVTIAICSYLLKDFHHIQQS